MNNFKFRAFGKFGDSQKENQMIYDWQDSEYIEDVGFDGGAFFEVMQWTGLKDKNDRLIFENDEVIFKSFSGEFEVTAVVKFDYKRSVFCLDANYSTYLFGKDYRYINPKETEVIGNIYEKRN